MNYLYLFLSGYGLGFSLIIFCGGLIVRGVHIYTLSLERDRQFCDYASWSWSLKSIVAWILPLGAKGLRERPFFALAFFIFHACLLVTPLFLSAHNILLEDAFGWRLPILPDALADAMTFMVILTALFLLLRRLTRPEVRIITQWQDYALLALTVAPFVTGLLAFHQVGDTRFMTVLHMLSGEILLIVIPFSKLGHLMLFFFTRAALGSQMGARRAQGGRLGARVW